MNCDGKINLVEKRMDFFEEKTLPTKDYNIILNIFWMTNYTKFNIDWERMFSNRFLKGGTQVVATIDIVSYFTFCKSMID